MRKTRNIITQNDLPSTVSPSSEFDSGKFSKDLRSRSPAVVGKPDPCCPEWLPKNAGLYLSDVI